MLTNPSVSLADLINILNTYRFRYVSEKDLQDGIEEALQTNGIDYRRETSISAANRPDFLVGGIVIEVKIKGTLSALLRQISRYVEHEAVESILVIGTPRWIPLIPKTLSGKEVGSLRLIGSLL